MRTQITFDNCCQDLLRPGATGATRALQAWRRNALYREVVPFVENFSHRFLYELGPESVRDVIMRSRHALGDVESVEQLAVIEDFHTPFALQHLFHWYVEANESLPTWTEFRDWIVLGMPHRIGITSLEARSDQIRARKSAEAGHVQLVGG
ncbi:hypothetical protein [Pseudoduganella sp. OTU4001]|uniref:hypothetical protein n=1 Tax=Pseudoduganella sp. OTU4001 TaxID=3043854 RepID=UPI00313C9356